MPFLIPALALLAATAVEPPRDPFCPQGDLALARDAGSRCLGELTEGYAFSVILPGLASEVPALDRILRRQVRRDLRRLRAELAQAREDSPGSAVPPFLYQQGWSVDADRPPLIALSAPVATDTGGAHGGFTYRALLFDRRANRALPFAALFTGGTIPADLQAQFCAAVQAAVRRRRDDPAAEADCPSANEQPISLICSGSAGIDTVRALIPPYVLGAWVEGPYEFDVPVTAGTIAAIKPRYRSAFSEGQAHGGNLPPSRCSQRDPSA